MEKFYVAMLQYIRKSAFLQRTIIAITRYFPMITFILYPCVLLYLFIRVLSSLKRYGNPLLLFLL